MSRVADRIYSDSADIARLEAFAMQLPQGTRVELTLEDGCVLEGIVAATPTVQLFFGPDGNEGMNGVVRIEPIADASVEASSAPPAPRQETFWLDRIHLVTRLPNPSPPEHSHRTHPPDPNAPTTG